MLKLRFSKWWYAVGALAIANIAVWVAVTKFQSPDYAKLYFFDVGQGDAIYLRTIQGNDVLIDGGPGDAVLSKLGKAMPFTDRTIELMILTHPHADHVSGLVEVIRRFKVEKLLVSEVFYNSATAKTFEDLVSRKGISVVHPHLGQRVFLDESTVLDIYYPVAPELTKPPKDINDVSMVARFSFGKNQVLFMGDAGKGIENFLVKLGLPLTAEVLKVGHHGSRHSTAPEFLKTVGPDYSVISVGQNRYGHPHEEVLGLFVSQEKKLLRTDEQGDIVFLLFPDRVALVDK